MIKGHCECNRIRFEVDGDIDDLSHCHCSQCRRLHGAAFATFAAVKRKAFKYIEGEAQVNSYASSEGNNRKFCGHCGSNILVDSREEPDWLYLSMSAVEGDPATPDAHHDWVGSKAPWFAITDDLAQHDEEAPEE